MKLKIMSQSFRLPGGRILIYAEYGAPNGKPIFYFHGLAGSRLEPAVLDIDILEEAGIRLIACDRPVWVAPTSSLVVASATGRRISSPSPTGWGWVSSGSGAFQAVADMYLPVPA